MEIYDLNNKFDFNNITLDNPYSIQEGLFLLKFYLKINQYVFNYLNVLQNKVLYV